MAWNEKKQCTVFLPPHKSPHTLVHGNESQMVDAIVDLLVWRETFMNGQWYYDAVAEINGDRLVDERNYGSIRFTSQGCAMRVNPINFPKLRWEMQIGEIIPKEWRK